MIDPLRNGRKVALRKSSCCRTVGPVPEKSASTANLSGEIEAVLLLSTPRLSVAGIARLRELLYRALDWYQVWGLLAAHRTMGMAWQTILHHFIDERAKVSPGYLLKSLEVTHKGQSIMADEQIAYTGELQTALETRGIRSVVLKGAAVASTAYPSLGCRVFNDNDILVDAARLSDADAVLSDLGYVQGSWSYETATVRPARRADVMLFPVHSHQTHPYMRPTPHTRTLECHRVDLHFSVDLMTSNRTDELVADLLGRRVPMGQGTMWTLHPDDMVIFGAMHYFKEATRLSEVVRLKDLVLYKLVDLLALLGTPNADPVRLLARVRETGTRQAVFFALSAVDRLFPGRVSEALLSGLAPGDLADLDEVLGDQGERLRWQTPLSQRFFNPHRLADLAVVTEP